MKKITCFSLVELLAVIVIGSILMSIAVPSFSKMIRGNASTQAGRELMGRIQSARAHTVAHQTPVALVFYGRELPDGISSLPQDYIYSAYRFCEVKYDSGTCRWVFQKWVGEWYFLPKGICVGLPRTLSSSLPAVFPDREPSEDEFAPGLIPSCRGTGNDSENPDYFAVNDDGSGVSPVYVCDVSDIFPNNNNTVTFRNAIVFNSNGMMEKPKNSSNDDSVTVLTPDVPVVIPLRIAFISGNRIRIENSISNEYIPVRIEPSGKTCFYDGYVNF